MTTEFTVDFNIESLSSIPEEKRKLPLRVAIGHGHNGLLGAIEFHPTEFRQIVQIASSKDAEDESAVYIAVFEDKNDEERLA